MIAGALVDTGYLVGKADLKADARVMRVLGRVLTEQPLSPADTIRIAREMHPENPWLLDRPLYLLGGGVCKETSPRCDKCF